MDKSWGDGGGSGLRVRPNESSDERARRRADERLGRAAARAEALGQRQEARAASRESEAMAREQARIARRVRDEQGPSDDPHAAAARRRRSSGRRDVVREQRDTRAYTTLVDGQRVRELARRGASATGLAGAFGITEEEVARILAGYDRPDA